MKCIQSFSCLRRSLAAAFLALALTATNAAAATEKILHDFEALPHGTNPQSALIADAQGNLYGVTAQGGLHGEGVVYELARGSNGKWSQKVLYDFAGINIGVNDGARPQGRLVFDAAGNLYGTTLYGGDPNCNYGIFGCGTVYKLTPQLGGSWTETVIHVFAASYLIDGQYPYAGLTFGKDGNLYGTTAGGSGTVFQLRPSSGGGWAETIIYSFNAKDGGGAGPLSEVVFDAVGNLLSTTTFGGDVSCASSSGNTYPGCGTVFELTPSSTGSWTETVLYTFTGSQNWIGPTGRLLQDSAGDLYGPAVGVVYKLRRINQGQWIYSVIRNASTEWDLAFDRAGNLYGENRLGNICGNSQCGTVFELQHSASGWTFTTLYSFKPTGDGTFPWGGLMVDASGNVFGTTVLFGDLHDSGSVFELSRSSTGTWQESVLFKFPQMDGQGPQANLVADSVGNLYGVAAYGGTTSQSGGIAFRLSQINGGQWEYKIIHNFEGIGGGSYPGAALVLDSSGNLFGTTIYGGTNGYGTAYKLSPDSTGVWHETILHTFGSYLTDGASPPGKLDLRRCGESVRNHG